MLWAPLNSIKPAYQDLNSALVHSNLWSLCLKPVSPGRKGLNSEFGVLMITATGVIKPKTTSEKRSTSARVRCSMLQPANEEKNDEKKTWHRETEWWKVYRLKNLTALYWSPDQILWGARPSVWPSPGTAQCAADHKLAEDSQSIEELIHAWRDTQAQCQATQQVQQENTWWRVKGRHLIIMNSHQLSRYNRLQLIITHLDIMALNKLSNANSDHS